jgi:surface antigen
VFCVTSLSDLYRLTGAARPSRRRPLALLAPVALMLAAPLGGCAISTQLGPIFGMGGDDSPSTGSITPRDQRFSNMMTDEDWTRARAAVDVALSEPPDGKPSPWENPASGLKGTVTPVASAYAADRQTCHAFVANLVESAATHWYQGRACRTPEAATWTVVETSTWTPPGQG